MSERAARLAIGGVVATLVTAALAARIPQFWADGATYHAMAWSLAEDGDLRYEARDVLRVRREFPTGPQGIFLKRASGGLKLDAGRGFPWLSRVAKDEPRVYYAKAFLYPLAAAPLVALIGTRGLLLLNALSLGAALVLAYSEIRRRASPARALATALVLFLATVAPLYLFWLQPELLNLGLLTGALVAWSRKRPLLAAVLLGLASYSKPYNVLLALPLGLEPLLERGRRGLAAGLREASRRALVVTATVAAMFGLNALVTGEINYQGGERKTFYGTFPFEVHGVTFGNSGQWMTTDHLGPLVEGRDEQARSRRTGPLRAPDEIRASFVRNLGYFWWGRFGGAVAYYFPFVAALAAFVLAGPRTRAGWLAVAALALSYVFYIWMIPDNWYGGGGTVGNRYLLNLLPLGLLLVPRGREWWVAGPGLLVSIVFLGPVWLAPVRHSLSPGEHATRPSFRVFPPELTMLNDLSVMTEPWRKKRPFGDTEGDARTGRRADPTAYYLYFLDRGTWGKDVHQGREGFWLRAGERCEIVLRALEPVHRIRVEVTGGPTGDEVDAAGGGDRRSIAVAAGETRQAELQPRRGFPYYDTFLYRIHLRSSRGASAPGFPPDRPLGAFVSLALETIPRTGTASR